MSDHDRLINVIMEEYIPFPILLCSKIFPEVRFKSLYSNKINAKFLILIMILCRHIEFLYLTWNITKLMSYEYTQFYGSAKKLIVCYIVRVL